MVAVVVNHFSEINDCKVTYTCSSVSLLSRVTHVTLGKASRFASIRHDCLVSPSISLPNSRRRSIDWRVFLLFLFFSFSKGSSVSCKYPVKIMREYEIIVQTHVSYVQVVTHARHTVTVNLDTGHRRIALTLVLSCHRIVHAVTNGIDRKCEKLFTGRRLIFDTKNGSNTWFTGPVNLTDFKLQNEISQKPL